MSRILYRMTDGLHTKSEIITNEDVKEFVNTTDEESEFISLEINSSFTSESA